MTTKLNSKGYKIVERPRPLEHEAGYRRLKRIVEDLERKTGDGNELGGTGLTILKFQGSPLARMFDAGKIYTEELRAAEDIQTAYLSLTSGLWIKPQSLERVDKTNSSQEPYSVIDAVKRYQSWAKHWSARAKRGDRTLEFVIAVVMNELPIRNLESQNGYRHGFIGKVVATALRDYLARAGWADPKQVRAWISAAESNFVLRAVSE